MGQCWGDTDREGGVTPPTGSLPLDLSLREGSDASQWAHAGATIVRAWSGFEGAPRAIARPQGATHHG